MESNIFPDSNPNEGKDLQRAHLIVCNPPWLPAKPVNPIETAIYDESNQMLKGFLSGLRDRLLPGGEGWLVLSDIAELLELRTREELLTMIESSGLSVVARVDTRSSLGNFDAVNDPLYEVRRDEIVSLWRLEPS